MAHQTHMAKEVQSVPDLAQCLLEDGDSCARVIGDRLRELDPAVITTIARGSSDHAAAYLKYAIELTCGIPVASTGPSVSSVYKSKMKLLDAATVAISQSGKSPDIVAMAEMSKQGGSHVFSLTNTATSPLAGIADANIDIGAGPELSVAATKTFILSIIAGLMVVAHWKQDRALLAALRGMPNHLSAALTRDWSPLADRICSLPNAARSLYVLGRGPSYAIASECALKFKETCQLHAEAYSGAEVMHGPVSIVQEGFPILALVSRDASQPGMVEISDQLSRRGVDVYATTDSCGSAYSLPFAAGGHPLIDPLVQVVSFYVFIERLARRLGLNPDEPPHLRKVTETL
jgi:glucosamine--fructose-6-phosphate aminotransferase (isomerizing)